MLYLLNRTVFAMTLRFPFSLPRACNFPCTDSLFRAESLQKVQAARISKFKNPSKDTRSFGLAILVTKELLILPPSRSFGLTLESNLKVLVDGSPSELTRSPACDEFIGEAHTQTFPSSAFLPTPASPFLINFNVVNFH